MPLGTPNPFNSTLKNYIAVLNELANASFTLSVQSGNFAAAMGYIYALTTNALQVTLPAAPTVGDRIRFFSGGVGVVSVTFLRNGLNIDSTASDLTITGTPETINVELVYVSVAVGWRVVRADGAAGATFEVKTTNFTAVKKSHYGLNASTLTVILPASPVAGDFVHLLPMTHAITGTVLSRNGSNINGAPSNVTVNAPGQEMMLQYVDATIGWLITYHGTYNPTPRFDSTLRELRYHDSVRELSAPVGWTPFALPPGATLTDARNATAATLAVNGGTAVIPIRVDGHMLLDSVDLVASDATVHTAEWRLYKDRLNNANLLDEIPLASGTFSYTGVTGTVFSSAASSVPYLAPGKYWLALRNTHATNTLAFRGTAISATLYGISGFQTKTLASALAATLDPVLATWVKQTSIAAVQLRGRVFGQATPW